MRTFVTKLALFAAAAATPSIAAAQVTTYSDLASFTAAAGPVTTETFAGCGNSTTGFSGNVSSSTGPCTGVVAGVTFAPEFQDLYIAGPGQSSNPTTALGLNTSLGDAIVITFDSAISAFAADLFQNMAGGSQSGVDQAFVVQLFGAGNVLIDTLNPLVSPNGGDFFGLTSTTPFLRVEVAQTSGFAVIDNVAFSATAAAVPEPGTWAMMLLGFGAVGFGMRRQRKARRNEAAPVAA